MHDGLTVFVGRDRSKLLGAGGVGVDPDGDALQGIIRIAGGQ